MIALIAISFSPLVIKSGRKFGGDGGSDFDDS
jgi:hypothetical protein